jgi:uncharacterized protein YjbJ (UPF0337 family)
MNKDELSGKVKNLKGREGLAERVEGAVRETIGNAKRAVKGSPEPQPEHDEPHDEE